VIGIIGKYIHPLKAQFIVERYCDKNRLLINEFSSDDVPSFILYLAKERDEITSIEDNKFFSLLSNLVSLSNSNNHV
jgi:hypothetical protein